MKKNNLRAAGLCALVLAAPVVSCGNNGGPDPQETTGGSASNRPSGPDSRPVAVNALELIPFPSAEGPSNHDGTFGPSDYESQIGFRNTSDTDLTIGSVRVVNATDPAFFLQKDECTGRTIQPDPTPADPWSPSVCIVWVGFDPPGPGTYHGQLVLDMPGNNSYQVMDLTGVRTALPSPPSPSTDTGSSLPHASAEPSAGT
ncbi:hypothetical protein [Kocuria sabuli]|uniref:hypothetical protein n=1 Tax=Kocuria sabuli TaxID=3071448 RepID=UPI0034D43CF8